MALLEPGLLSEQARRQIFAPVALADGTPTRYALGFQVLEDDGRRLLLQPGGGPGIAGWLAIYPDEAWSWPFSPMRPAPRWATRCASGRRSFLTPGARAPSLRRPRASAAAPTRPPAP